MVRKNLKQINYERSKFTGVFERFGTKNGYFSIVKGIKYTLLLKDIKDNTGKIVTTHLWFNLTKGFCKLNLKCGDTVEFNARVVPYIKGYQGHRNDIYSSTAMDYKLSHPTKIKIINRINK